jgi:cellobiose-specific phosphotransferase system component IIB
MDFDNGTNMILAMDRGQYMEPNMYDDKKYLIKRLTTRMRKADFKFLSPQIQQMYQQVVQQLMDMEAEEQRKIQEAAAGFIPMSGMAVVCDIYVPDPSNSSKTMRARVPYDALTWLLKRLEEQGATQQSIMQQQQSIVAQTADRFLQNSPSQPQQGAVLPQPGAQPQLNPTQ